MKSTTKQSTQIFKYNRDFHLDDNDQSVEFIDINLACNKLGLELPTNNSITHTKKNM